MAAPPIPCTARAAMSSVGAVGQPARQRGQGEDGHADHEDALAPEAVGQRPLGEDQRREAQGVGRDDPLQVAEAGVQRPLHGGQGHLDDGDVHQEHERRPAHGDEGPPVALVPPPRPWPELGSDPFAGHLPSSRRAGSPSRGAGMRLGRKSLLRGRPGVQDRRDAALEDGDSRAHGARHHRDGACRGPSIAFRGCGRRVDVGAGRLAARGLGRLRPRVRRPDVVAGDAGPGGQHLELGLHLRVADLRRLRRRTCGGSSSTTTPPPERLPRAPGPPPGARSRRRRPRPLGARHPDPAPTPGEAAAGRRRADDELAAYNRYLAELNASGRQKRW